LSEPVEPPALAQIEKTLADAYRRELEREENIWRSLPCFAATLALHLAALFQIVEKLPNPQTITGAIATGLLALADEQEPASGQNRPAGNWW